MSDVDRDLSTLSRAEPGRLKSFAETLITDLGPVEVLHSRTGLVMVPMRDTAQGTLFHLGEALVSEAHIRGQAGQDGYGLCLGHDLERSMAMALLDLALKTGLRLSECRAFVDAEATAQAQADRDTLRRVEATRVQMETF